MNNKSVYNDYKFIVNIALGNQYIIVLGSFIFLCITLYMDITAYKIKKNYNSIIGNIKSSMCKNNECSLNISYVVKDIEYQNKLLTTNNSNSNYKENDKITIRYNKRNKNKIILKEDIFIGYSIFGILGFIGSLY